MQKEFSQNKQLKSRDDRKGGPPLIGRGGVAPGHVGRGYFAFWDTNSGAKKNPSGESGDFYCEEKAARAGDGSRPAEGGRTASSHPAPASRPPLCRPGERERERERERAESQLLLSEMQPRT